MTVIQIIIIDQFISTGLCTPSFIAFLSYDFTNLQFEESPYSMPTSGFANIRMMETTNAKMVGVSRYTLTNQHDL